MRAAMEQIERDLSTVVDRREQSKLQMPKASSISATSRHPLSGSIASRPTERHPKRSTEFVEPDRRE